MVQIDWVQPEPLILQPIAKLGIVHFRRLHDSSLPIARHLDTSTKIVKFGSGGAERGDRQPPENTAFPAPRRAKARWTGFAARE
jgi:hypothetical protein